MELAEIIKPDVLLKTIDFQYIIHKYEEILNNYDKMFNLVKEKFNEGHYVKLYEYTLDFTNGLDEMKKILKQGIIRKNENKFPDINKLLILILKNNINIVE